MKRVLIVSPRFPPINAPDHQRVRMCLPFLRDFSWEATVLAVDAAFVEGPVDEFLKQSLPEDLHTVFTKALPLKWTRRLGIGNLAYRGYNALRKTGDALLKSNRFDLMFFSTTAFVTMNLAPRWRSVFGTPYILDFQDPWVSDYYTRNPAIRPPGGRIKYGMTQWLAGRMESRVLRNAAHVICVSDGYESMFRERYRDLPPDFFSTLPFGALESDFALLAKIPVRQELFDPNDGRKHWVYIGRGGADMSFAVRSFFKALKRHMDLHPQERSRLRIHFAGTDYAPKNRARKTIEPLACECGVGEMVSEDTDRMPYFSTLRCLSEADALFIPGSDDSTYTASKVYPYILARKPLLAVFHKASSVPAILNSARAGTVVTFDDSHDLRGVSQSIYERWFARMPLTSPSTDWAAFAPYTARAMSRRLCGIFDRVTGRKNSMTGGQLQKSTPAGVLGSERL